MKDERSPKKSETKKQRGRWKRERPQLRWEDYVRTDLWKAEEDEKSREKANNGEQWGWQMSSLTLRKGSKRETNNSKGLCVGSATLARLWNPPQRPNISSKGLCVGSATSAPMKPSTASKHQLVWLDTSGDRFCRVRANCESARSNTVFFTSERRRRVVSWMDNINTRMLQWWCPS